MKAESMPLDPDLFLPEPEPREVRYTVISVDDHLVEPAHTFHGRLPAALVDGAPRIVETQQGQQVWQFEGESYTQIGMNAVAGRRPETVQLEPFRFEQMRPGCYDVEARHQDMDINGVWASLNFPSQITGFCGRVFFMADDPELGLACVRAWNDWLFEKWYQPHPDRIIPLGITFLADPDSRRRGDRRNAARGFSSVTLPERPHLVGLPSLWISEHWNPILDACVDNRDGYVPPRRELRIGATAPRFAPVFQLGATLFGQQSLGLVPNGCGRGTPCSTRS